MRVFSCQRARVFGGGSVFSRVRAAGGAEKKEKEDGAEESRRARHSKLEAKNLKCEGEEKEQENPGNGTTRYRHLGKILSRFCDFNLTRSPHGLILRFQIRGTWKRQKGQVGTVLGPEEPTQPARDQRTKPARSKGSAPLVKADAEKAVRPCDAHRPEAAFCAFFGYVRVTDRFHATRIQ